MRESYESQEARRRKRKKKILERSSDWMTFITPRIQSFDRSLDLDCSSSSSASRFSRTQSAPVSISEADGFSQYGSDEASRFPFNYGQTGVVRRDGLSLGDRMNSLQDSLAPFHSEVKEPTPDDDARISRASNKNTLMFPKSFCNQLSNYFTAKDINSTIISSENTRVLCSIMIAVLVVIAYANLPQHVIRSKSIIASSPVYVLLVSEFMIVILQLCFTKQNTPKVEEEKPESTQDNGSNWDEAIKVLEWGLVLYQTLRAIFIDCSFFTVIVVCGFSFL